ncbi:MAG: polyprenyl synthetase family protein [Actinomycetota bacterium]
MSAYPDHLRVLVDDYLGTLDFAPSPGDVVDAEGTEGLVAAMRYSLLAGGKRIRPVLALATCEALGRAPEELLPTAAAIELVHTYSLIHDDLPSMDDDDLRRGRPTCHREFGEDTAILAGDALYAEAVRLVCERQGGGPAVQVGILRELTAATGVAGMVGGQYLDLKDAGHASAAALRRVHALKTGRLIACAVRCALVLAPPPPETELTYREFARELGLLFQIVDDILDADGSEEMLGKAVGADAAKGKATYVTVHGIDRARELAAESHARARALLDQVPGDVSDLAALTDLTLARHH